MIEKGGTEIKFIPPFLCAGLYSYQAGRHRPIMIASSPAAVPLLGVYRLDSVMPDDYVVHVSTRGYTLQQAVHRISRGKMDVLDFHLAVRLCLCHLLKG